MRSEGVVSSKGEATSSSVGDDDKNGAARVRSTG